MSGLSQTPEEIMDLAVEAARLGAKRGHRPFGAVVISAKGTVLAREYGTESPLDPTRHSEMLAIKQACLHRGMLLYGCTLASTHQPCPMCAGAITHAKVARLIFGSHREDLPQLFRPKPSALVVLSDTSDPPDIVAGVRRKECVALFASEIATARVEAG